ncbi:DUF4239 domain-containing protein [Mucilaginibacter sp. HMF5004]|uniref:bestrophin-like domain n=1 Tax=Mucilaginibacter rivuli TaxID=2857527 RepID=UPI001C5F66DE|nr:DUF4239 domain-containing protein [Mucilaginibacter rivuli]MBW4889446.1 DUF4239 domain-containing protein [Mucilaginibacter rivuli]
MDVSYHLLQLRPFVLLSVIVVFFGSIGALGTYFFRKYIKIKYKEGHNEVVGYIFAILGGFYGLLLGFVVFFVWDTLNQSQTHANQEGSLARGLYRDIKYYPDSVKMKPLMKYYMEYVHAVVEIEYPTMQKLQPLTSNDRKFFNNVFREIERLDASDPRVEQMFRHLNELATYRGLRQLDGESDIPVEIWIPLLLGGLIILIIAILVKVESLGLHIAINASLGAFIGIVIYLIVIIDHPFTGELRITPTQYNLILQMQHEQ